MSVRNICVRYIISTRVYSTSCSRSLTQNKVPKLYGDEVSPPVRFVMMTASHLGIKLDFHKIDLFLGENKTEFYTKINPLQKVPVLDTGDDVILDSHAIALYLCRQIADNDLYPLDTLKRAKVEELLFFNSSNLFTVDSSIFTDYFSGKSIDSKKVEHWNKLLDMLDARLKMSTWLAGDKMTLGDLCCAATISSLEVLVPLTNRHIKVQEWMKRLERLSCFVINSRGISRLATMAGKI